MKTLRAVTYLVAGLVSGLVGFNSASEAASRLREVKTFDGQVMRCESLEDQNRMGYQINSIEGEIQRANLVISIDMMTMRCRERAGIYRFEPAPLQGRTANSVGGFIEFSSLELVAYTPDLKVVKSTGLELDESRHRLTITAPVNGFAGLLPRNTNGNGDRRIVVMALLRGQATMGVASNGRVMQRAQTAFGAYALMLSENAGTLKFAPRRSNTLASAMNIAQSKE